MNKHRVRNKHVSLSNQYVIIIQTITPNHPNLLLVGRLVGHLVGLRVGLLVGLRVGFLVG